MKVKYIVEFDDVNEAYCSTKKAVLETLDEMIEDYCCKNLSKRTILKDVRIYQVTKEINGIKFQKQ